MAFATLPVMTARAAVNSVIGGVRIGNMTYSFRDLPLDTAITAQVDAGIGDCELDHGHVERTLGFARTKEGRAQLRDWRLSSAASDGYKAIRRKLQDAGLPLWGMIYSIRDDFTDEEIERGFQFARS